MSRHLIFTLMLLSLGLADCSDPSGNPFSEENFQNPPDRYKPMPFWHINGELTTEGIWQQMRDARDLAGFSGVSLLPLASREGRKPGTLPKFMTEAYFDRFQDMLDAAEALDMQVILYDDNDFPSGMAGGMLGERFPEHTMKRLDKIEREIRGPAILKDSLPRGNMMAAVAMNPQTLERIDVRNSIQGGGIHWEVPAGNWKMMYFMMVKDSWHKAYPLVDYLDTVAVRHLINLTYDEYEKRFGQYFGNIIRMTFFDDVGFWRHPRTWTGKFNEKFRELNGYDPAPYYPALWYDIGPETGSVRHAFFDTRAELLAEGYTRLVGEWTEKRGLLCTGHPPGNYDPTPIDMNGDIFKFYRHVSVPLTDAIIRYQFGQDGHKLISSAADYYDRPVVSTEIYGAFREHLFDSLMLYRPMMEMFVRGVNFVIPHGMWYNSDPQTIHIPPLVSPYSDKIAAALPAYSDFVGRACMLLQGGRRVADIGVIYPFESLAGWYRFEDPDNPRQGFFVSPETDYLEISGMLSNEIRRDFTFIHPEFLLEEKYQIDGGKLILENQENRQTYKALVLTGCNIISWKTLQKIRDFWADGGTVISTTLLPFKSSEMGEDQKVIELVKEIFGIDPVVRDRSCIQANENPNGGKAIFIPEPDPDSLGEALQRAILPDVTFSPNPSISNDFGKFSYIHKIKGGRDIFYFANSSDEVIQTDVLLRGTYRLEQRNPHTGETIAEVPAEFLTKSDQTFTRFHLHLDPVKSLFFISR